MGNNDDGFEAASHPEIVDEFEASLLVGVEDYSAEETTDDSFIINSYGADYPVDTLVKRMTGKAFFIPKFQRKFVWSHRHASRFIESLLMGLPVPGIFLYKEAGTGKHLVVDGQQRLRSLQFFYEGIFQEKAFRLVGVNKKWEGKTYKELETSDQLRLDDSIVHATIFQQDEPKAALKSLYFVFERINTGGIRLSPQEIRNCITDSEVMNTVRTVNTDENWRSIFGERQNSRLKDEELVLRCFAMIGRQDKYYSPMRDFLNDFAANEKDVVEVAELEEISTRFSQAMKLIFEAKGKAAFRPDRALNAAVMEAVTVGLAERLKGKSIPSSAEVGAAYDALLLDDEFRLSVARATAREDAVKKRQTAAIKAFAKI